MIRLSVRKIYLSRLQNNQSCSVTHRASYSVGIGGTAPRVKGAVSVKVVTPLYSRKVANWWSDASVSPISLQCLVQGQIYLCGIELTSFCSNVYICAVSYIHVNEQSLTDVEGSFI